MAAVEARTLNVTDVIHGPFYRFQKLSACGILLVQGHKVEGDNNITDVCMLREWCGSLSHTWF